MNTATCDWKGYWLPQDMYNNMSRAERMKHRRKQIKRVERKFEKIEGVMSEGTAKDKRKLMEHWINREPAGALKAASLSRQKWERV